MSDPNGQPDLEPGDRVRVRDDLGGFFRPRVRRGTVGIVIARTDDSRLAVSFQGHDLVELVDPDQLGPV